MKLKRGDQSSDLQDIMGNFLAIVEEEHDQTEFAFD
jgi:hypothetical protein